MVDLVPYYTSPDGAIAVYHARWEDVVAAGLVPARGVSLVHADPPYGVMERTDRASKGRGKVFGSRKNGLPRRASDLVASIDFPAVVGDDSPYDPAPLLALGRPTVLWGANHYAPRVPESPSWLLWDKRDGTTSDDNADGELAWTNMGGPLRIFRHLWRGMIKASERQSKRKAPTQKPVALSRWVFEHAMARRKLKRGDLVFVPYLGSGPDLPAAQAMGLRLIGCDVESWCCKTAVARLGAAPHPDPPETLGPLFAREP